MEETSPARLYCLLVGGVLVIAGIIGFFYSASFDTGATDVASNTDDVFGILGVNGWHNIVHIATGALGLLAAAAGYHYARQYAYGLGVVYIAIAIWGFAIGSGESILGFIPINTEDNFLHLLIGVAGVGAGLATPATQAPSTTASSTAA
jgi:hypothetical protein